ncbi:polysaccharide pyruvyl transferase family protein [Rhodococcus sp. NPDC056960]|uniref:polysaccharide pyruvyl transferase family protein n=1 Tax=Rhodococcus sp. NPDC056960 TaxID=3345982 RepID=UPI00363A0569
MSSRYFLYGGWGHDNIGDDLILDSYIEFLSTRIGVSDLVIVSVDPAETRRRMSSMRHAEIDVKVVSVVSALASARSDDTLLVCGGGYINGIWRYQCSRKLIHILLLARRISNIGVHSVQISSVDKRIHRLLCAKILQKADWVTVRDQASAEVVKRLGATQVITEDAISISRGDSYRPSTSADAGIVVNMTDVLRRGDHHEAEFDLAEWSALEDYIRDCGMKSRIRVLCAAEYEYRYAVRNFPNADVIYCDSVDETISNISSAKLLIATRMHLALAGIRAGIPTVAIAYNGKVRPTLTHLGFDKAISEVSNIHRVVEGGTPAFVCHDWSGRFEGHRTSLDSMLRKIK